MRTFCRRSEIGASLVELFAGLLVSIPIFFCVFGLAIAIIGIQNNDKTCREAARFAANGAPVSAQLRAQSVVDRANEEKPNTVADLRLISVENTLSPNTSEFIQNNGGTVAGEVKVTTAVDVKPFFGNWLFQKQQFWTFQSQHSFPYTYISPNRTINE